MKNTFSTSLSQDLAVLKMLWLAQVCLCSSYKEPLNTRDDSQVHAHFCDTSLEEISTVDSAKIESQMFPGVLKLTRTARTLTTCLSPQPSMLTT